MATNTFVTKEEICKKSYELLLEHHKQFAKILARFKQGKIPSKDDWENACSPFSKWKRWWDQVTIEWDSENMEFITRKDLRGLIAHG